MKRTLRLSSLVAALALLLLTGHSATAALSGTYTINPSGGATASNYLTFASAISDMVSGTRADGGPVNGPNVSGPVTFNVAAGTYSGQITIPAITGASSTNTITFDGGNGNTDRILSHNTASVITLNGAKWIRLRNLTINQTSNGNVQGILFLGASSGASCDNNKVQRCTITLAAKTAVDVWNAGIYFNCGVPTSGTCGGYYINNLIDSCTVTGGNSSVYGQGVAATNSAADNVFSNNSFSASFSRSMQFTTFNGIKVLRNSMAPTVTSSSSTNPVGISLISTTASASNYVDISYNKIYYGSIGILFSGSPGTATLRTRISNNMVHQNSANAYTSSNAIRLSTTSGVSSSYLDIWFNSFTVVTTANSSASLGSTFVSNASAAETNLDIRNNIFAFLGTSGVGQPFYATTFSSFTSFNYNIFYSAVSGTPILATYGGANYTTASAFPWGSYNANSYKVNPNFDLNASTGYLHLSPGAGQSGVAIAGQTTDIDDDVRAATPTIGADEPPAAVTNDLAINAVTAPATPFNAGSQSVTLTLYNNGSNTLTQATLNYTINGGSLVTQTWNGSLAPSASTSFTFTTQGTFTAGANTIAITSSLPGGDNNTSNNSMTVTRYTNLCGNYTINGSAAASSTNFTSFTSAANGLSGGTVTCAVNITVSPGTYTEQATINTIAGTSSTNTVTIDGVDSNLVTLTFAGSPGSNHTLRLNGCQFVTVKNMKIRGTGASAAWTVHFGANGTSNNVISDCSVYAPTTTVNEDIIPVLFSTSNQKINTPFSISLSAITTSNNTISNCVINGGIWGIYYAGVNSDLSGLTQRADSINSVNSKFLNNTLRRSAGSSIKIHYASGVKIQNNLIYADFNTTGGIQMYGCNSSYNTTNPLTPQTNIEITGNRLIGYGLASQGTPGVGPANIGGIEIQHCRGRAGFRTLVANNMIGYSRVSTAHGIYHYVNHFIDYWYNSISYESNGNSDALYLWLGTNNTIKNNIFATTGTTGSPIPVRIESGTPIAAAADFNYNIFYNAVNTNQVKVLTTTYTTANVIGGGGYNVNSVVANPNFVNGTNSAATDLHITAVPVPCVKGIAVTGVTTDIDGQTRANPPVIGADEIVTAPPTISVSPTSANVCAGSSQALTASGNSTSYSWAPATGLNQTTGASVTATPTATNTYTVTGVSTTGCTGSATSALTYVALPVVNVSPTSVSSCVSGATLTASGGTTYSWSPNTSLSATTGASVVASPTAAVTYTVTGTTSGCSNTATSAVTPYAKLSGTYTINNAITGAANLFPNTTVFNNFSAAATELACRGVSSAVTFNVAAGTYSEQVILPAVAGPISGASATNTITFDGGTGNAATRIVTSAGTGTHYGTFILNGVSWVRLKNLTIRNTSGTVNGFAVQVYGNQLAPPVADNNIIRNCIINAPVGTGTNTNTYGIVFSTSYTSGVGSNGNFTNNTVDSNTVNNGHVGIGLYPWSTNHGNEVNNNVVINCYSRGIDATGLGQFPLKVRRNKVTSNSSFTSYRGIYLLNCGASATDFTEISGNIVPNFNQTGIGLATSNGSATQRNRVVNNFIGGAIGPAGASQARGIIVSGSYVDVWFNSVNINQATTASTLSAFASTTAMTNLDVRNNIFAYTATSGSGLPFYASATPLTSVGFDAFDYNIFYNAASATVANVNGTTYNTNFIGAGGFNINSAIANPSFDNNPATNYLHVFAVPSPCMKGVAIPGITTDIDGQTRANPPVIGADEANPVPVPPAAPTGTTPVCQQQNGVAFNVAAVPGAVAYLWTLPSGATIATGDSTSSVTVDFGLNALSGNISVKAVNACGNSDDGAPLAVTVNPAPLFTLTPLSAVCLGLNNAISVSGGTGTYNWTPSGAGFTSNNAQNSAVTIQTQGTPIVYTVTGSLANGCTTSGTVQVASTPTGGTVAPASSVVCSGGSKTFTVTGQVGSTQWQKSTDNINWTDIAGATSSTYNLTGITQNTWIRALAKTQICYDIASTSGVVAVSQTPVLSIVEQTATSVTVSWTPSSSGDYTLTWSGAAGSGTQQTGSPFTIQSLSSGAALNLSVSKTSGPCAGTSAGTLSTYTLCAPPTAVAATPVTTGTIQGLKVTWTGSASSYRVSYRPLTMNSGWITVDTTGTTKTIKPLYAGVAYAIRVQALDCPAAGQVGAASTTIYAYTNTPSTACNPIPQVLSATSSCPNQITVNLSGGPVWRVTLRRLSPTFSAGVSYQTSSAVTNFTLGSSGGSVWEVFATTVCGTSSYSQVSNVMTVTVKAPCEAPQNIVVSHPTCNGFAVSWNPYLCSGGIPLTHYQIYLKRAGYNNWVSYNVGPDDGHHIFPYPSLVTNTLYSVYVRAFACNGAASAPSPVQTISTASAGCREEEQTTEQTTAQAADGISVMLYPNPTTGSFNVDVAGNSTDATDVKIEIVNAVGQVLQTDYASTAGNHDNFYVQPQEHIASGLYLVRVTVGESVFTQRLVVQQD